MIGFFDCPFCNKKLDWLDYCIDCPYNFRYHTAGNSLTGDVLDIWFNINNISFNFDYKNNKIWITYPKHLFLSSRTNPDTQLILDLAENENWIDWKNPEKILKKLELFINFA